VTGVTKGDDHKKEKKGGVIKRPRSKKSIYVERPFKFLPELLTPSSNDRRGDVTLSKIEHGIWDVFLKSGHGYLYTTPCHKGEDGDGWSGPFICLFLMITFVIWVFSLIMESKH
jgi:hypothetical protein